MAQKQLDGAHLLEKYDQLLASYAQKNADSRGRKYPESADPNRLPFQRDRDRVIHTKAFRRLQGKTQVVRPRKGDHYRNRLSHTIEVAQMARDLARTLRLNEDLAESLALSHDLGHPPFGHGGETVLDMKMKQFGLSFEHNQQSLRIVETFEQRYPDFDGLNLTYEVLEGLRKHDTKFMNEAGQRIYTPHLESQLVDLADGIAYLSADLEDSIRGGFVVLEDLEDVPFAKKAMEGLSDDEKKHRSSVIRAVFRLLWRQLVDDFEINIQKHQIQALEDVQQCQERLISFSKDFQQLYGDFKAFLFDRYYRSPEVMQATRKGQETLEQIFDRLMKDPSKLPETGRDEAVERRVCDYVAGMTDRFAEEFLELMIH